MKVLSSRVANDVVELFFSFSIFVVCLFFSFLGGLVSATFCFSRVFNYSLHLLSPMTFSPSFDAFQISHRRRFRFRRHFYGRHRRCHYHCCTITTTTVAPKPSPPLPLLTPLQLPTPLPPPPMHYYYHLHHLYCRSHHCCYCFRRDR